MWMLSLIETTNHCLLILIALIVVGNEISQIVVKLLEFQIQNLLLEKSFPYSEFPTIAIKFVE